jgi:hypothetical protein
MRLQSVSEKGKDVSQLEREQQQQHSIPTFPPHIPVPPTSPTSPTHRKSRPRRQPRAGDGIHILLADPRLLDCLLQYLHWAQVRALCHTSRRIWHILSKPKIKDVLFAHFVPGYVIALRFMDRRHYEDVIAMDLHDLDLLGAC